MPLNARIANCTNVRVNFETGFGALLVMMWPLVCPLHMS